MMIRTSTLIPAFLLTAGLALSGLAVAQAANDNLASPDQATIAVASNDCVSNSRPDPQDCYPPNHLSKHALSKHSA
jgi:hypothetical protein